MKIEELRSLHQARPFQPFAIHTADGRILPIPHSEFLAYNQDGGMVGALCADRTFSILDLNLVTDLERLPANGKSKTRGKKGRR